MNRYDFFKMGYDVDEDGPEFVAECVSCGREIWAGGRYYSNGRIEMCPECYECIGEAR